MGPLQDAEVDPAPARGAGLDVDLGMGSPDPVDQLVGAEGLGPDPGPARGAAGPGGRSHQVPVVIPLHVGDVVGGQDGVDPLEQVLPNLGPAEVQHQLMAAQHRLVPVVDQGPFGMGPVEIRIGVDHLGFEPDAEVHAQGAHVVDDRVEPFGPDLG